MLLQELEKELAGLGKEKDKRVKAAQAKLKSAKAGAETAKAALKAAAGALAEAAAEREAAAEERAALETQLAAAEQTVKGDWHFSSPFLMLEASSARELLSSLSNQSLPFSANRKRKHEKKCSQSIEGSF